MLRILQGRKGLIINPIVCIIIFFIIFLVFKVNMIYFYVGASLCFIFIMFSVVTMLVFEYRKEISIEEIEKEKKELVKLLEEQHCKQNDLEEYFLLWMHQMKTPITAGKLLLEERDNIDIDQLKNQFIRIEKYSLMAMNYIKITNPDMDMEYAHISIHKIIVPIIQKYSIEFISKNIKLHYEPIECKILTEPKLLSIVIEQTVSNALKYTNGGDIWITYEEEMKILSIKDNGIGIASENIDKIFNKGYSGFNGRLNEKSSGIGLFLAKEISKRLNYSIVVKSQLKKGSEFIIEF